MGVHQTAKNSIRLFRQSHTESLIQKGYQLLSISTIDRTAHCLWERISILLPYSNWFVLLNDHMSHAMALRRR
jgi:hypothetical protein